VRVASVECIKTPKITWNVVFSLTSTSRAGWNHWHGHSVTTESLCPRVHLPSSSVSWYLVFGYSWRTEGAPPWITHCTVLKLQSPQTSRRNMLTWTIL